MDALIVEWMLTADGGRPDNTWPNLAMSLVPISQTRPQRRVPTTELPWCGETCMPMRCGKHYGCQGTRARCVGYKPTNTKPCPRVGYPALGAGHARDRGGFVHHSVRASHPTQYLAVNLYADVIKFAHLQHQVSFHDLVAPVVRLTTDARCRRGRSHEQSGHQQETAGDH